MKRRHPDARICRDGWFWGLVARLSACALAATLSGVAAEAGAWAQGAADGSVSVSPAPDSPRSDSARPPGFRYQGVAGAMKVRGGPLPHRLGFLTGYIGMLTVGVFFYVRKRHRLEAVKAMRGGGSQLPGSGAAPPAVEAVVGGIAALFVYGLAWGQPVGVVGWMLVAASAVAAGGASFLAAASERGRANRGRLAP